MKPKVGDVWLVNSGFSWGQCLVLISGISSLGRFAGFVLDGEKDRRFEFNWANGGGIESPWHFRAEGMKDKLMRLIERGGQDTCNGEGD